MKIKFEMTEGRLFVTGLEGRKEPEDITNLRSGLRINVESKGRVFLDFAGSDADGYSMQIKIISGKILDASYFDRKIYKIVEIDLDPWNYV